MIINHRALKKAMELIEPAREARPTIPILSTVRARRLADGLKLTANNLDMEFTAFLTFDADTPVHGLDDPEDFLIVDPKAVMGAVAAAGGSTVQIGVGAGKKDGDHRVQIEAGALKLSQNNAMMPDDFPAGCPVIGEQFAASLSPDLIAQIARVFPAISTEETRYYLNGVNMKKLEGDAWTYRFAATDGHRLFLIDIPLPDAAGDLPSDVILPRQFIQAIVAALSKSKDAIPFKLGSAGGSNQPDKTLAPSASRASRCSISGKVAGITVQFEGKLIDGTYPAYERVIPTNIPKTMTANLAALRQAVNSVRAACSTKFTPSLRFDWSAGRLRVSKALGDLDGDASFEIECDHNCDGMWAGFNGKYFLETLNSFRGDEITISLEEPAKEKGVYQGVAGPALFRDPCDPAFKAVLMPMRV